MFNIDVCFCFGWIDGGRLSWRDGEEESTLGALRPPSRLSPHRKQPEMRRSSHHHARFPPPPPRRHPQGRQQLPSSASFGDTGSRLFAHRHRHPDTRPDHLPSIGHASVWCRRLDPLSTKKKRKRTNQLDQDPFPRFSGYLSRVPRLPACRLPPGGGTTMASLQKTLFSASRTASSRLQFATRRRTLPISIPRILQVHPSTRFASTMAPKVRCLCHPSVTPESQLTGDTAQRSLPLQKGRLLCQWRMGNSQVGQDL